MKRRAFLCNFLKIYFLILSVVLLLVPFCRALENAGESQRRISIYFSNSCEIRELAANSNERYVYLSEQERAAVLSLAEAKRRFRGDNSIVQKCAERISRGYMTLPLIDFAGLMKEISQNHHLKKKNVAGIIEQSNDVMLWCPFRISYCGLKGKRRKFYGEALSFCMRTIGMSFRALQDLIKFRKYKQLRDGESPDDEWDFAISKELFSDDGDLLSPTNIVMGKYGVSGIDWRLVPIRTLLDNATFLKNDIKQYPIENVSVIGLGHVGLPVAIMVAEAGYCVSGFDIDEKRVNQINLGQAPFAEPGLSDRLNEIIKSERLQADCQLQKADCYIITVPTPFKEGKKADLDAVFDAGRRIAMMLEKGALIIIESTVPAGTTQKFVNLIEEISGLTCSRDFFVAHCPEGIFPSNIFYELERNNRVIGGVCLNATEIAAMFYRLVVKGALYLTDDKTAEMIKLIQNSSRDVQLAFANQLAAMCEQVDVDPFEVVTIGKTHPRYDILYPGCGVGGHCIAVDPWFLVETFPQASELVKAARIINDTKPYHVVEKVIGLTKKIKQTKNLRKPVVLLLGLAYKANVDDLRESPALTIAQELSKEKSSFEVIVCEPHLTKEQIARLGFESVADASEGIEKADIVVVSVKHTIFEINC
jgi:UDP-N-acetyl-D-mannosaminuronic acid dehydrogenase